MCELYCATKSTRRKRTEKAKKAKASFASGGVNSPVELETSDEEAEIAGDHARSNGKSSETTRNIKRNVTADEARRLERDSRRKNKKKRELREGWFPEVA